MNIFFFAIIIIFLLIANGKLFYEKVKKEQKHTIGNIILHILIADIVGVGTPFFLGFGYKVSAINLFIVSFLVGNGIIISFIPGYILRFKQLKKKRKDVKKEIF